MNMYRTVKHHYSGSFTSYILIYGFVYKNGPTNVRKLVKESQSHAAPLSSPRWGYERDTFTRWSHVCLIFTRNVSFARLLAQIIQLRAQFPDHPIKTIRLDNVGEFSSQAFIHYWMSIGIDV